MKHIYLTMSNAMRLFTDCDTFWAIFSLASFIRTLNFAFRFFTFYITNCISGFLATGMTSRWSIIIYSYSHTGSQIAGHLGSSHFHAH